MQQLQIRKIKLEDLKYFYKFIERDFPVGEYAPYYVMMGQLKSGSQEGWVCYNETGEVGYAFCTVDNHQNALISLFAIHEGKRGQGIGTRFLQAICGIYSDKKVIVVEVERSDLAKTSQEADVRLKRIAFYERTGFFLINHIEYCIWDVPMGLMALSQTAGHEEIHENIGEIIYGLYLGLMGERFMHKLQFRKIEVQKNG